MAPRDPARHELPDIDAAALAAARAVDRLLTEARRRVAGDAPVEDEAQVALTGAGIPAVERWAGYFERLPDQLRDEPLPGLRAAARKVRSAFGPKDSIRDAFPPELTEPLLDSVDRLLKAIARYEVHRG